MEPTDLSSVARWVGVEPPALSVAVAGVSTDTRTLKPGEVFVALKGPRFDAHLFVREAACKGAAAAIVQQGFDDTVPIALLRVPDTLVALGDLAAGYRRTLSATVVAVTGSDGKTTTKEMIRRTLSVRYRVSATLGNLNNQIGVPLTLCGISREDEVCVVEMGMNRRGELARLAEIAAPDIGVVTNIGWAHAGPVGGRRGIAAAKAELVERLTGRQLAIVNRDSPYFEDVSRRARGEVVSFGTSAAADVRGSITATGRDWFSFRVDGMGGEFRMRFWNPVWLSAALACVAVARVFGIPEADLRNALAEMEPGSGRGQVMMCGGVEILDESYNSNPESLRAALRAFASRDANRRIAVIGDMAELGRASLFLHRSVGLLLRVLPIDRVVTVGKSSAVISALVGARGSHAADAEAAAQMVATTVRRGDCILIKGSRVVGLERVVEELCRTTGGSACSTHSCMD